MGPTTGAGETKPLVSALLKGLETLPEEGASSTMLEVLSPDHLRAAEDQLTVTGHGGKDPRAMRTQGPGSLSRWQGASGPESAARVRAAVEQPAAPPFCPPEPAGASAAALGGTVHSPQPR